MGRDPEYQAAITENAAVDADPMGDLQRKERASSGASRGFINSFITLRFTPLRSAPFS
jgi:hypothetical protein